MTSQPNPYLPVPFALRWRKELESAMRQGNWHVHAAGSQHGKSTENRHFFLEQQAARRSNGQSSCLVALAWATDSKKLILRSIAESIGGRRFAQMPNPELRVPNALKQLGTKLIIVNNGHNMDWRQWNELLTLDDICWTLHGIHVGVVLSGVHKQLGIVNMPKQSELIEQITKRVTCYKEIPGHDRAEVKVALKLLLERDAPKLLERGALTQSSLVFELLTRPEIDATGKKRVATFDLVELVRRLAAFHARQPRASSEEIVRRAFEHYVQNRVRASAIQNPAAVLVVQPVVVP